MAERESNKYIVDAGRYMFIYLSCNGRYSKYISMTARRCYPRVEIKQAMLEVILEAKKRFHSIVSMVKPYR